MSYKFSSIEFTEASSTTYSNLTNTLSVGMENINSVVRAPLVKAIPYLEQGVGATLAPCLFVDNAYIYSAQVTSTTVLRVNRWNLNNGSWAGFISLTVAGTGVKTCRDLWIRDGGSEILLAYTSATTLTDGGIAWVYGVTSQDWGGVTFAIGTTSITSRTSYCIRQNATNTLQAIASIDSSTPNGSINSGTANSFTIYIMQSTNTSASPAFVSLDLGTTFPTPSSGIITILDTQRIISGVMTGDYATYLPSATLSNLIYAVPGSNHVSGVTNVPALFYTRGTTTSRIGRIRISDFISGFTTESDYMTDVPPLGSTLQQVQNNFTGLAYSSINDLFIVLTNGVLRDYSFYYKGAGAMLSLFGFTSFDNNSLANTNIVTWSTQTQVRCSNSPIFVVCSRQITNGQQLLMMPFGCHNGYVITKEIQTTNCTKFYKVMYSELNTIHEPVAIYYRTSGISDNTGEWIVVPNGGDLTGIGISNSIQFKIVFSILGTHCVSAQVDSLVVIWENGSDTDSHYQPSVANSNITSKTFAWRFSTSFGSTVPRMRVRLYDAISGGLLIDDDTTTLSGTFERSTDNGATWTTWNNTDKANDNTYLRYTPATLADNIKVRALLTQY